MMGYYAAHGDLFSDIWGAGKTAAGFIPGFGGALQTGMGLVESAWGGIKSIFGGSSPKMASPEEFAAAMSGLDLAKRIAAMNRPATSPGAPITGGATGASLTVPDTTPPQTAFWATPDSEDVGYAEFEEEF